MSVTAQNLYKRLKWLRDFKLDGGCVPAQFLLSSPHWPLHAGKILLQLALTVATSQCSMESVEGTYPLSLDILVLWHPLNFHQMECCLYLEVKTQLSDSGMYKLVGLSRPSLAIPAGFPLFPFHKTAPQLPQDLKTTQSVCGILKQGGQSCHRWRQYWC